MSRKTEMDRAVKAWREMGPVRWCEYEYGWIMEDGKSIVLTDWQRACLLAWWKHKDDISTLAISSIKKCGKTILDAILLCWRWLAIPGLHLVGANNLDQSKGLQFQMISDMLKRHSFFRPGTTRVKFTETHLTFLPTNSRLRALPVSHRVTAGSNHHSVSHTEAWGIMKRDDIRNFEELTIPPGKWFGFPALRIVDSYAGWEGESDTFHNLVDRGLSGKLVSNEWPIYKQEGLLLFHAEGQEAQERCFRGTDIERERYYAEQRRDLRINTFKRLHLNQRTSSESNFCTDEEWELLIDPKHKPLEPTKNVPLYIGADAATSPRGDDMAVIAFYPSEDGNRVLLAWHKIWKGKSRKKRLQLGSTFEPFLEKIHLDFWIHKVYYDPFQLLRSVENLKKKHIPLEEVTQNLAYLGPRGKLLSDMVGMRALVLYDHPDIRKMHLHAAAKEVTQGIHIKKSGSGKIDLLVAASFCAPPCWEKRGKMTWEEYARYEAGELYPERKQQSIAEEIERQGKISEREILAQFGK